MSADNHEAAVIGASRYGLFVAQHFVPSGYSRLMYDIDPAIEYRGNVRVAKNLSQLASADMVFVTIPYPYGDEIRDFMADELPEDTLVADFCSVMEEPARFYESVGRENLVQAHTP